MSKTSPIEHTNMFLFEKKKKKKKKKKHYLYFQDQLKLITGTDRDLVAIGDRCFRLGRSIFAEMIDLLDECAVVVVVLSKNYCASEYCRLEIEQARLMRKPIVVFIKE